ncbi:MAG TPA: carbohydrate ABC transporter permease [Firmicutes bacterium]|mgnify:CR=1 FL=1|nr:carbohydrate ABC transporter permease [Bacillota bacterium]
MSSFSRSNNKNKINNTTSQKVIRVLLYATTVIVLINIFLPLFFTILSMFKDRKEIFDVNFHIFPQNWTLDNFNRLFYLQYTTIGVNFFQSFGMTLLVASVSTILSLIINSLAGYAFARLSFPGKKIIWAVVISTMFIPGITILLTSISVVSALGMLNTIWVLIVPGLASAYNIFFFKQFYLGFPKDYDEAARVDGCNSIQIFFKIFVPNSITPMVIMGAGTFIGYYNSYLWPTLTIDKEHGQYTQIMTLINYLFSDISTVGYGAVLAASFISLIPAVIVFIIIQRYIKEGISLTGVK